MLLARGKFPFQGGEVKDADCLAFYVKEASRLQAAEVAGDQFAGRADLEGEFLVAGGESELDPTCGLLALLTSLAKQKRQQQVPNRGEGQLFNDGDQPTQACADYPQDLQSDFWVLQAKSPEVFLADEEQSGVGAATAEAA